MNYEDIQGSMIIAKSTSHRFVRMRSGVVGVNGLASGACLVVGSVILSVFGHVRDGHGAEQGRAAGQDYRTGPVQIAQNRPDIVKKGESDKPTTRSTHRYVFERYPYARAIGGIGFRGEVETHYQSRQRTLDGRPNFQGSVALGYQFSESWGGELDVGYMNSNFQQERTGEGEAARVKITTPQIPILVNLIWSNPLTRDEQTRIYVGAGLGISLIETGIARFPRTIRRRNGAAFTGDFDQENKDAELTDTGVSVAGHVFVGLSYPVVPGISVMGQFRTVAIGQNEVSYFGERVDLRTRYTYGVQVGVRLDF